MKTITVKACANHESLLCRSVDYLEDLTLQVIFPENSTCIVMDTENKRFFEPCMTENDKHDWENAIDQYIDWCFDLTRKMERNEFGEWRLTDEYDYCRKFYVYYRESDEYEVVER